MHRFIISQQFFTSQGVILGQEFAHRMGRVLRLRPGDQVVFLDNSGWEYDAEITRLSKDNVEARITGKRQSKGETYIRLHLFQSLLKLDKFELVLQKGVELGIASFTPVISLRNVSEAPASNRISRWQRIILEAAEQSHRGRLPPLTPAQSLSTALSNAPGQCIMPWEGEGGVGLHQALGALHSALGGGGRCGSTSSPGRSP